METEIGGMWSKSKEVKECLEPPEARRGKEEFFPRAFGGSTAVPADALILDFCLLELR